jgi:hypothetical protein
MKTFLGRKVWGLRRSPGPAGTGPRRAVAAQAYVEYLVILIFTVAAVIGLTAPLGSQPSALDQLVEAFKLFWAHYSFLISLP